jgi:anti-sigma regulatory factor (Ser/Thr protein kinase)
VKSPQAWQGSVVSDQASGNFLGREISRLLGADTETDLPAGDLAMLGIQWRECFQAVRVSPSPDEIRLKQAEFLAIGLDSQDEFSVHEQGIRLGEYLDCLAYSAVADTVNIGVLSQAVRHFVEELAYSEEVCYNTDLAVSEALTNVMLHGFRDSKPAQVHLLVLAFQHGVGVLIEDTGQRIPGRVLDNMRKAQSFQDDLSVGDLPEGGMGLAFMRMVSRRFVYRPLAGVNRLFLLL